MADESKEQPKPIDIDGGPVPGPVPQPQGSPLPGPDPKLPKTDNSDPDPRMDFSADPKSILQSRVLWGVVIALVGKYVPQLVSMPELAGDVAALFGAALAVYGRVKATRPISSPISRPSN